MLRCTKAGCPLISPTYPDRGGFPTSREPANERRRGIEIVPPRHRRLRALAVLGVIAFHFGMTELPGGFVGVDIFFVISGYLITQHLVQELDKRGTVDLWAFYARRARRLLPASIFVILVDAGRRLFHPGAVRAAALLQGRAVRFDLHHQFLADPLVARLFRAGRLQQPVHPFLVAVGRGAVLSGLAGAAAAVRPAEARQARPRSC